MAVRCVCVRAHQNTSTRNAAAPRPVVEWSRRRRRCSEGVRLLNINPAERAAAWCRRLRALTLSHVHPWSPVPARARRVVVNRSTPGSATTVLPEKRTRRRLAVTAVVCFHAFTIIIIISVSSFHT